MKFIKRVFKLLLILLLLCGTAGFYAIKIEPYRLVVKTHSLGNGDTGTNTGEDKAEEEITIVQVSDIQISPTYDEKQLKLLVEKINDQKPDIFLFTGDLYDNYGKYGPEEGVISALSSIEAPLGKYAIYGNRDCGGGSIRRYSSILEESGIRLLKNEAAVITLGDNEKTSSATDRETAARKLLIGGVDDYLLGSPDISPVLESMSDDDSFRILMTHEPDTADEYANDGFDLILAGHSHGGQVWLPFIGSPSTSMARKYRQGFYHLDSGYGTELYVNSGIGTSHYPARFLVPPEITVFRLTIEP